jgi:hypothetical protein
VEEIVEEEEEGSVVGGGAGIFKLDMLWRYGVVVVDI